MTASTHAKIPVHLRRYIVEQDYSHYTPEDQAVWRFIMRQLKNFLSVHAHESYVDGLQKTGISVDRIPSIHEIDEHLQRFGWGAVPVSGFIPPAAFMEFQSLGILPIASDMRTLEHLLYTPAPDIVHEAAGHAPILVHPEYAAYLKQYGSVARHSIISKEDLDQYEAIRMLSDIKEDPRSTEGDVRTAEDRLEQVNASLRGVSEAGLLSRMNWWTAEYGLIGDMDHPKIFGAGLLSSVGESRSCLEAQVKKIPLSVDCVKFGYDITNPQPQLFVARSFQHLGDVLEDLAKKLSYRLGGLHGLDTAKDARTVNTVQLNSGIQIAGVLVDYITNPLSQPAYLQFKGPSQLALNYHEISGQGVARHPDGFGSPVGMIKGQTRCLSTFQSETELRTLGLVRGQNAILNFESGVQVSGVVKELLFANQHLVLVTWDKCRVTMGDRVLFDPAWGPYDMAVGSQVTSVFGGPADRTRFGQTDDFANKRVPARQFTATERAQHELFQKVREYRESGATEPTQGDHLATEFLRQSKMPWLIGLELIELGERGKLSAEKTQELRRIIQPEKFSKPSEHQCVRDGLTIAARDL